MMRRIEQVIILGAGASKSEGAPLQNELFELFFKDREGFEDLKKSNPKIWNLDDKQEKLIKKFFNDFWGIEIINYKNQINYIPTFEECLGMLDLANMQGQSFKGYDQKKINKFRNALIFLISARLNINKLRENNHKELINRLKSENRLKETAFISLNYDIIIDNILTDLDSEFKIDYGIDFINFRRHDELQPPDPEKSVLLLKPHGSLNWLYCPTCNQIKLFPKENIVGNIFLYESYPKDFYKVDCKNCGTIMKFVIIPMTYYKDMSNPFIQQLFLKSDEILRQADRIFICGYSFPDADIHIKYLLKRAELFKGETPEIYVINNHESYLFSWDEIPGNDTERLIDFISQKFNIDWVKTAKIEKINKGNVISITNEKKILSLRLNNEKIMVNLNIDDGRMDKFNVKTENGKINIYHGSKTEKQKEEELRFKRFFKNKKKIHYTNKSFQDFAKEGIDTKMVVK